MRTQKEGSLQEEGWIGRRVGGMIRRSVRARFRKVYWVPPTSIPDQCIFVASHHGWHDGYIMFHVVTALQRRSLDWIQEFASFPLFAKVGGMPFPLGDAVARAVTVKKTIRLMRDEKRSLILFGEGVLHRGPEIWEIGKSLSVVSKAVPEAAIIPVAIRYDMGIHERPEVFVTFGNPLIGGQDISQRVREELARLLSEPIPDNPATLVSGTLDVNERWDMRRLKKSD
jgi:1-acyl-sn-glycerol-3-phosphate acyltransferase